MQAATPRPLDEYALEFLGSEFAGDVYINWPIDRRLEGFLRHQGMHRLADTGEDFSALLDRVMANLPRARRSGLRDG